MNTELFQEMSYTVNKIRFEGYLEDKDNEDLLKISKKITKEIRESEVE